MRDRRQTLITISGVAVAALVTGILVGKLLITSPADAAARTAAPEAGLITVPVEYRALESRVVTRGDASFAGAVELTVEIGGLDGPPIVTGQVPEVGDEIDEGDAVLEITGRPVIALEGDLPMYRTLRPGMSGPDVEQLEETLDRLGFDPGTIDENYTAATGRAVREMYDSIGYEAPAPDESAQAERDSARDMVQAAEDEVRAAEESLKAMSQGPSESERVMAQQAVDAAERALKEAKKSEDENLIADAEDQLELAKLNQKELLAGQDTSAEQAAVQAARSRLAEARTAFDEATAAAGTPLPSAEIIYVSSLPRRVDEVNVRRGGQVDGAIMSVSGADMVVTASISQADRTLLDVDMSALIDLPTGEQVEATITGIEADDADGMGRYEITLEPDDLTVEQVDALRAMNVRVIIPVSSTEGEVLAVPLAALSSGPGGEARVEVERDGEPVLVVVEVGLTADGYAEVVPVDGGLEVGDLVVVGNGAGGPPGDQTSIEDGGEPGREEDVDDGDETTDDSGTEDETVPDDGAGAEEGE